MIDSLVFYMNKHKCAVNKMLKHGQLNHPYQKTN